MRFFDFTFCLSSILSTIAIPLLDVSTQLSSFSPLGISSPASPLDSNSDPNPFSIASKSDTDPNLESSNMENSTHELDNTDFADVDNEILSTSDCDNDQPNGKVRRQLEQSCQNPAWNGIIAPSKPRTEPNTLPKNPEAPDTFRQPPKNTPPPPRDHGDNNKKCRHPPYIQHVCCDGPIGGLPGATLFLLIENCKTCEYPYLVAVLQCGL